MVVKNNSSPFSFIGYCCTTFLAIFCAFTFAVDMYFNLASMHSNGNHNHYDKYTPTQLVHRYGLQITPASWATVVWAIIYSLLAVWFLYIFYLLLCRQLLCSGLHNKTSLFPAIFWLLFIIVNVLNGIWVYLFADQHLVVSGIVLLVLTVMLYVLNLMAYRVCWVDVVSEHEVYNNNNNNDVEHSHEDTDAVRLSKCELVLLRFLTLNGLPLYAMWCTLAAGLQWAMIFRYSLFHWSDSVACVVALAILTVVLLVYWVIDLSLARSYMSWTWFADFGAIVFFASIIQRQHSVGGVHHPGLLFAFVLLIVSGLVVVLKSMILCCKSSMSKKIRFSRV
jgi:hypothetical protein